MLMARNSLEIFMLCRVQLTGKIKSMNLMCGWGCGVWDSRPQTQAENGFTSPMIFIVFQKKTQ